MATNAATLAKTGKFGDLRRRLVFLLLALVVYRVGRHDVNSVKDIENLLGSAKSGTKVDFTVGVVRASGGERVETISLAAR